MTVLTLRASDRIHLVKEVKCEKGLRKAATKCGTTVVDDSDVRPSEWTAWASRVTCPYCKDAEYDPDSV